MKLINRFPLRNTSLIDGNLDTRYSRIENDWQAELIFGIGIWITFREMVRKFNELFSSNPIDAIILFEQNRPGVNDSFEHFIDTIRNKFSDDQDVRNLLSNPIFQN